MDASTLPSQPSTSLPTDATNAAPSLTTPRSAVRARRTAPPWLLGFVLPLGLALGWEIVVRLGLAQGRLMPPPSKILDAFWSLARTGELWVHVGATLGRVLAGFAFGALFGTLLGAFAGASERFRWFFDPTLQALRAVPSIAWVPLFLLWFGIFETSKIILIAVGVFFPVYLGVAGAIAGIDRKLLEVGRVFRLSPLATVRRVMLPAVLPEWIIAIRSGLGLGFMFVVAAELMGASEGLGYLLLDGQQMGRPDQILAAIIAFALLGKICDGIVVAATAPLTAWQDLRRGRL